MKIITCWPLTSQHLLMWKGWGKLDASWLPAVSACTRRPSDVQRPYQTFPCGALYRHLPSMQYCTCFVDGGPRPQSIHLWGRELGFSTIFFWRVDMCIHVSVCVYVCMNIWKAEVDFGCLPQLFPPYFLRQGFTQNLKLPRSARLAAQ